MRVVRPGPIVSARSRRLVRRLLVALAALAALVAPGLPAQTTVDAAQAQADGRGAGAGTRRVIVRLKERAANQTVDRRDRIRQRARRLRGEHALINAFTADVDDQAARDLASDPDVAGLSIDAPVHSFSTPAVSDAPALLRETLGLDRQWSGKRVGVAVIDSGLAPTKDFAGRIVEFRDFTRGGIEAPPYDDYGHGTHVAGIIGGSGRQGGSRQLMGIAPDVRFVALKVLDAAGAGWTSDVVAAIEFAVAHRDRLGIDIINLSLGHPILEPAADDPLVQAVEAASRAGIIVVASAGNVGMSPETGVVGYAGITSPGNAPSAITVGAVRTQDTATRHDDRVADYSSRGPTWFDAFAKPDVVAPGHRIVAAAAVGSTLHAQYPAARVGADYLMLSGTSMAAGVVSGIVAQMIEASRKAHKRAPRLTPNAVKAVLQYTAVDVRPDPAADAVEYDALTKGAGSVNARGALDLARAIDTTAPERTPWLDPALAPSRAASLLDGEWLPWSQQVSWGADVVWGPTLDEHQPAWATGIVWGKNVVWGQGLVWGFNVVWGQTVTWANHIVWGNHLVGTTDGTHIVWGNGADASAQNVVWGQTARPE